jgi:hypothetical protein
MAGIDKTYTSSWKEYKELVDWARGRNIDFKYGKKTLKVPISNAIYQWNEEDFTRERPVLNTATWEDKFLWDNCPCQFVIDRLRDVYGDNGNYLDNLIVNNIPDDFKTNRKITIVRDKTTKFPISNKGLYSYGYWSVQTVGMTSFWYSKDLDAWVDYQSFPWDTNTMNGRTVKSIVRRLRKMYLPSGLTFMLMGNYVGEHYLIKVK